MGMYRYKRGIKCNYDRQGYIYFASRQYRFLQPEQKAKIRELCRAAGGEHREALFQFVTSDKSATEICMEHFLSKATLYRAVQRYYEDFPKCF